MQRILFIIPLYNYMGKSTTIAMPAFSRPYGMLSIDVYIKANVEDEIETDLLDLNIEAFRFITGEREYNLVLHLIILHIFNQTSTITILDR